MHDDAVARGRCNMEDRLDRLHDIVPFADMVDVGPPTVTALHVGDECLDTAHSVGRIPHGIAEITECQDRLQVRGDLGCWRKVHVGHPCRQKGSVLLPLVSRLRLEPCPVERREVVCPRSHVVRSRRDATVDHGTAIFFEVDGAIMPSFTGVTFTV